MKQVQRGFTLIELVMVIVILGVLAAVALPKFVDLKGDASQAAISGVAGAVSSASAINYAKYQINGTTGAERLNVAASCNVLVTSTKTGLTSTLASSHATIATDPTCAGVAAGTPVDCVLQSTDDTAKQATATLICTG